MSDLIHRAQQAKRVIADDCLAKAQRAEQALRAFSDLVIDDLEKSVGDRLEADLTRINAVLDRYSLNKGDDYRDVHDADLDEILALVGAAAAQAIDAETDRIMAELDSPPGKLPEDAIREAREHRELMVPRLIQALKDAIAAARGGEKPENNAHFFSLFLLTEFKASEAFPVILEALTLPDDLPDELFGDAIYDLPPRMFAVLLGDRVEAIEAIIDDRSLRDTLRWGVASSYLHLVHDGRMSRDDAVRQLRRHLRQAIDNNDDKIGTGLVCELNNYAPADALDDIREAYERGLVDKFFIGLEDIQESIAQGESVLRKALARCRSLDTLDELRTWGSFREKPPAEVKQRAAPLTQSSGAPAPHFTTGGEQFERAREPITSRQSYVGRNDPCPCGSGKKFKKCCGARA